MERVRTSHPSPAQLEALVQFLERKPSLAKGFSKSLGAKQLAHKEWSRLATTLNSMGGCIKNDKKWIKESENLDSESPSILARGLYEEPVPGISGVLLEQPIDYTPDEIIIDNAERNNFNAIVDHGLESENITLQNQEMPPETVPVAYNTENADSVQVNVSDSERIPLRRRSRQPPSVTSSQAKVVVVDDEKFADVSGLLTRIFMPQGYPNSVSKDYVAYQIWDTAQAFCSTITGTLATQEVLRGVGVGDTGATPLAATITWVIKDGCGHLGRIIFAYSHGTYLDAYSKKWRLYADTLNDAAMCIEIALPLFKNYTTFALCVSTVMKAIVGVAGGATRAAMTQHHAVRGNLADVSAKDSAQETAVNLVASFTALLIITLFGNSIFIFIMMIILHIIFNYLAVRAVCLRTLNEPRFLQVIETYLRREMVPNPCEVNRTEPIIFYQLGTKLLDLKICGFQIHLGQSMKQLIKDVPKMSGLKLIKEIYSDRNYIVYPSMNQRLMCVYMKEGATVDDILCSYFHAVLLSIITCTINDHELSVLRNLPEGEPKSFAQLCQILQEADWSRVPRQDKGFSYGPSERLLRFVNNTASQAWQSFRIGLTHTGWDMSKHLLIVDEWRIYDAPEEYMQDEDRNDENSESDL